MEAPAEYEKDGKIFVEGKCSRCGRRIINEIKRGDV
jgi:hypothetical protein